MKEKTEKQSKVIGPQFERKTERKPKAVKKTIETDDTVCVALNRPMGIKFTMADGHFVEINGNGEPLRGLDKGILVPGSYGLTIIKAEDWDYIVKTYGGMRIFKEGLCFATRKKVEAQEEAESRDDLRNGLEPVEVDKTATKEVTGAE
jgi:hypothetical protein